MKPFVITLAILSFSSASSLLYAQPTGPQENVPLTLFQILGRSDCAVHVRVTDGEKKYATVEVLELLSGADPGKHLRIDFRDLNLSLKGQEPVKFTSDEQDVLFLHRPEWRKPSAKNADVFELLHGRRGRMLLPPEGGGIYVDAVRQLSAVTKQEPSAQLETLRIMLGSDNPILREASLAEASRMGTFQSADLPILLHLIDDRSPGIRTKALEQMRLVLGASDGGEGDVEARRALEAARERARNDPEEKVRAAAVKTMSAWKRHEDVMGDLKAIADSDISQLVRYEAQRVLYLWSR